MRQGRNWLLSMGNWLTQEVSQLPLAKEQLSVAHLVFPLHDVPLLMVARRLRLRMTVPHFHCDGPLVFHRIDSEGFGPVMPAQAGIQEDAVLTSSYASWIPGLAVLARNDVATGCPSSLLRRITSVSSQKI